MKQCIYIQLNHIFIHPSTSIHPSCNVLQVSLDHFILQICWRYMEERPASFGRESDKVWLRQFYNYSLISSCCKLQYRITDKPLLIKSSCVLGAVILSFFTYSFISNVHMEIGEILADFCNCIVYLWLFTYTGWIAVLGAVWLIILVDIPKLEFLLEKIEWATLLFFAALFIMMEVNQYRTVLGVSHSCPLRLSKNWDLWTSLLIMQPI